MPELPEVETIKLELKRLIKNKKILSVDIRLGKQIKNKNSDFLKNVIQVKIVDVSRRGKNLIISLANKRHLLFHLKMTGQLIFKTKNGQFSGGGHPIEQSLQQLPNKYTHLVFSLSGDGQLFFNDSRKFGWVELVDNKQLKHLDATLGPEPLAKNFEFKDFKKNFKNKQKPIKPLLMDPGFIAGIGNIYAAEICFCAAIKPTRPANQLTVKELRRIFICLKKILTKAIKFKGTSSRNYVDAFGRQGSMNRFLKVYGRAQQKCLRCGYRLQQIRQAGRSTVFCDYCQK